MDRRAAGAALLIAATLIAVVIPTFSGRRWSGSAVRSPAEGPPVVGQCLVEAANDLSALPHGAVTVLAAASGPCGPSGFGEVVSVMPDARAFPSTMAFNRTSYPDPPACKGPAREYLGWAAPYSGSLRTGTAVGAFPPADAFGFCVTHPGTARERPVSCGKPHDAEIFGWAPVGGADSSLMSSCRALVTLTTGMIDPGARGSLRVRVGTAAGDRVSCGVEVVGNSRLGGGLTWIAKRPQGR